MSLSHWGWSGDWISRAPVEIGLAPARVVAVHREAYVVATEAEEVTTELSGRMLHLASSALDFPTVGDWVLLRHGIIDRIVPRRTMVVRKAPGDTGVTQAIAANVDLLFLVSGLDHDLNIRRLERYFVLALDSGATPVFVLNKADLCASPGDAINALASIAAGREVILTSAAQGDGLERIRQLLPPGITGALLGSSGVGKSTLMNHLIGSAEQEVREVRMTDSRGRHTTTRRQLFRLPQGGLLIDQPGLREIQLSATQGSLDEAFPEISSLLPGCRFRDCRHLGEPGCAVANAVAEGELEAARLRSFHKLQREVDRVAEENDIAAKLRRKQTIKRLCKGARDFKKPSS